MPSHGHVVTISSLRTLAKLAGQMPRDQTLVRAANFLHAKWVQGVTPQFTMGGFR